MQLSKSAGLLGFLLRLINRAADHPAGRRDSAGALGMQAFYRQKGAGQLAKARNWLFRARSPSLRGKGGGLTGQTPSPSLGGGEGPAGRSPHCCPKECSGLAGQDCISRGGGNCSWLGVKLWFGDTVQAVVVLFLTVLHVPSFLPRAQSSFLPLRGPLPCRYQDEQKLSHQPPLGHSLLSHDARSHNIKI